jgi:hypothetical protein
MILNHELFRKYPLGGVLFDIQETKRPTLGKIFYDYGKSETYSYKRKSPYILESATVLLFPEMEVRKYKYRFEQDFFIKLQLRDNIKKLFTDVVGIDYSREYLDIISLLWTTKTS